jgi:hypothetical protein
MKRWLIGLWVLVFALGAVAVVKNMGGGSSGSGSRSAAARASSSGRATSTSSSSSPFGSQLNVTTTVTIHTENDVLDHMDGVAPPGATRWDDFRILNQGPGVDVAVAEAIDGSGAMAFYAFASDDDAQAFVDDPPLHLSGIGDYNALQSLPLPSGLPPGAKVADLRTCPGGPRGVPVDQAGACPDGTSPRSSGVIVVVPLDTFALVAAAWDTTPGPAASATQARASGEVADALSFWAHNK